MVKKYTSCHKFNEILVTGTDISLSEPPTASQPPSTDPAASPWILVSS